MIKDVIFFGVFIAEVFWTISFGGELICKIVKEQNVLRYYISEWKKLNIIGKVYYFIMYILSIPAIFFAGAIVGILYLLDFIVYGNRDIFYKK